MTMITNWFRGFTKFEIGWLVSFSIVGIALSLIWGDSPIGLISTLTGMICVVLVAKGKISNYYFGIIQVSTYAYLSYTYGLYGEAMLNALFYFPSQFIGLYLWKKNKVKQTDSVQGEDIAAKKLGAMGWVVVLILMAVLTYFYAVFLEAIGGRSVGIDSATNILSITAQILMLYRFAEQWLLWIAVNILSITMWVMALVQTGGGDWTMVVMWSAFLVNSIYGYINWSRLAKKQEETN